MVDSSNPGPHGSVILHRLGSITHRFEFAGGSIGFVFGLLVMTWDYLPPFAIGDRAGDASIGAPAVMIWIFLIAAQFAFWASAVPFQWRWRDAVKDQFEARFNGEIAAKYAIVILLFAIPAMLSARMLPGVALRHHQGKTLFVNLASVVVAFVAVRGIWNVRAALDDPSWKEKVRVGADNDQALKHEIRNFLLLGESLQRFIMFLGAMIGLGTLIKGAARHAFLAAGGPPHDFPPEYVLLHGAYFTGLLALVYTPTYTNLMTLGRDLVESVFPVSSPDLDLRKMSEWQSNRESLEGLLKLRDNALHNLRASLAILAPLASSAVSVLLGDKSILGAP